MDKYSYANQQFNPTLFAIEEHIDLEKVDSLAARLAAMGLLGFDLDENSSSTVACLSKPNVF